MVKKGNMLSTADVIEILAIDLVGVVPDDEAIIVTTNKGEPAVSDEKSRAGLAYKNTARRILGEKVPLMDLWDNGTLFYRLKKIFAMGKDGGNNGVAI